MTNLEDKHINKLKKHSLLALYFSNELTAGKLSSVLNINNHQINKVLKIWGIGINVQEDTIITEELLKIILTIKPKSKKRKRVKRQIVGNPNPKPKNKLLLKNWKKRDEELKNKKNNPKATIIYTPMGGKVKK